MDVLFSGMYEVDIKGGRPALRPGSFCAPCSCRCSTASVLSASSWSKPNNLLFRWFIGFAMDDAVWVFTVFTKNRERLIEHDAVIELFNLVLEQAERFSVDGTFI
jgi:hypothetical protein